MELVSLNGAGTSGHPQEPERVCLGLFDVKQAYSVMLADVRCGHQCA